MHRAIWLISEAFKQGLRQASTFFERVRIYFIGTSYAPAGKGEATLQPVAVEAGIGNYVEEYPDRIPYFEALQLLVEADMLLIPGSVDPNYTASKLYPYILAQKPLLAVFNKQSSVVNILRETKAGDFIVFDEEEPSCNEELIDEIFQKWLALLKRIPFKPDTDYKAFEPYTAREMTRKQVHFFEKVLKAGV
jgi:hypothetical protein